MADALERYANVHWPKANLKGHVVTRYGHDVQKPLPDRKITIAQAAHPYPDKAGVEASQRIMELVGALCPGDLCIALISGGGSSLLALPAGQIQLESLKLLTEELLRCGAPIEEINIVRKHVSDIQGGRLAQLAVSRGATVRAFIISDVVGDQASDIASGPCSPDPSSYFDAVAILEKYGLHTNPELAAIVDYLHQGQQGLYPETLKDSDAECTSIENYVFASAQQGLESAARYCKEQDYEVHLLGDHISGEAKDFAAKQAQLIRQELQHSSAKKMAWISGGETTVTIPKGLTGRGGRCSEFLLALMQATMDIQGIRALAADTDVIDGSEHNAGAFFHEEIRKDCIAKHLDIEHYMNTHQAYSFFEQLQGLVITGPTLTNVNDFRIVLIDRP
jgi:hydroxypyruvate reductase